MKHSQYSPIHALALCALTTSLCGQHLAQTAGPTSSPLMPTTVSPIRAGSPNALGQPSGIWAGGPNYKVSFHDGMVFYPQVGADLPHQPLRWRTTSVRAGATELLTAGQPMAMPSFTD